LGKKYIERQKLSILKMKWAKSGDIFLGVLLLSTVSAALPRAWPSFTNNFYAPTPMGLALIAKNTLQP